MKYQNIKSFEKHLQSAAPHHLCRCYLIAISDDAERTKAMEPLLKSLKGDAQPVYLSGGDIKLADLFDALESPPLFGGDPVVILDDAEKLGKKEAETVAAYLEKRPIAGYLIIGSRGKTPLAKPVEKIGVVLDMADEKPWDKDKRLAEAISEQAKNAGKRLSPDVVPLLFERLESDGALLEREIDKLICFVGERLTIERSDVFRISAASKTHTVWKTAETFIWEGEADLDASSFHSLIPALRSQLEMGLKIAILQEEGVPQSEWSSYFPKIYPRMLEKRAAAAAQKGRAYFKKGLELLFKIELLSRTGSNLPGALLALFQTSMVGYGRR